MLNINVSDAIFCDGLLTNDKNKLLFMSVWGRDTAISEWLARLTLPGHEQGVREFVAHDDKCRVHVLVPKELDKYQARKPGSVFGDLIQLFLFDPSIQKPDGVKRQAWSLYELQEGAGEPDIWPLIMETCHVPLMEHWRGPVTEAFEAREWITRLSGYRVGAIGVDLSSDDVETCIEQLVVQGILTL